MGRKHWGYITAYAVLVIGSALAIILGHKPLSSTVVSLALFGFNLAALMFLVPQVLEFITDLRQSQNNQTAQDQTIAKNTTEILQYSELLGEEVTTLTNRLNTLEQKLQQQTDSLDKITTSQSTSITATTELVNLQTNLQTQISQLQKDVEKAATAATTQQPRRNPATDGMTLQTALRGTAKFTPLVASDLLGPETQEQTASEEAQAKAPETATAENQQTTDATATAQPNWKNEQDTFDFNANVTHNETTTPQPIRLRAKLTIGENDVICIRGEGGGLDWEEGVPMRDGENNTWEWNSHPTTTPVTCQLYLNDEIAAFGEDLTLTPGQTLEISPSFPKIEA